MSAHMPPLLDARTGDQIAHRSLNLAPRRSGEDAVAMREIHRFEVVHESIKKRAESELRDRIEIGERLGAAKKNVAELGAIVQRICHIAPLDSECVYRRMAPFLRLISDLDSQINQRRNSNHHSGQLANGREHFPVHTIFSGFWLKTIENLNTGSKENKAV